MAPSPDTVLFSVDVEDYFISPETIPFEDWPGYEDRLHVGMEKIFDICEETGSLGTFFWVGWEAERHPEMVKRFHEAGHEIATHTYTHHYVHSMDEQSYRASLKRSLDVLEGIIGGKVIGHRAPAWSIRRECRWAVDAMVEYGLLYDSSINPYPTYLFGDGAAPRHPYRIEGANGNSLLEIPPTVVELLGRRLPTPGGGMLRALPLAYHRWVLGRYRREGHTPMIYVHPWELDPDHPPLPLPRKQARIHSLGHRTTERKLRALLKTHRGVPIRTMLDPQREGRF